MGHGFPGFTGFTGFTRFPGSHVQGVADDEPEPVNHVNPGTREPGNPGTV
jgi:hypothetical protein